MGKCLSAVASYTDNLGDAIRRLTISKQSHTRIRPQLLTFGTLFDERHL